MRNKEDQPEQANRDRDTRLSDLVLGQLDEPQRERLELELQANGELRGEHGELSRIVQTLAQQHASEPLPDASPELREAIEARLAGVTAPLSDTGSSDCDRPMVDRSSLAASATFRQSRRRKLVALAITACLLVLLAVPLARRTERFIAGRMENNVQNWLPNFEAAVPAKLEDGETHEQGLGKLRYVESQVQRKSEHSVQAAMTESKAEGSNLAASQMAVVPTAPLSQEEEARQGLLFDQARTPYSGSTPGKAGGASPRGGARSTSPANVSGRGRLAGQEGEGGMAGGMGGMDSATRGLGAMSGQLSGEMGGLAGGGGPGMGGGTSSGTMGGYPVASIPGREDYGFSGGAGYESRGAQPHGYGPAVSFGVAGGAPGQKAAEYEAARRRFAAAYSDLAEVKELQKLEAKDQRRFLEQQLRERYRRFQALQQATSHEQYAAIVENPFVPVSQQPLSTFSIDVDTASYANVRRFLSQHQLPPANAIRIEELINYFSYDYPGPEDEHPFASHLEVSECPWQPEHRLVRIGLQGKRVARDKRPGCNLVFLLDVSGSMKDSNKLPLLKQAMKLLVDQLNENDRVAIVTYASQAGVKLKSTVANKHEVIRDAIDGLQANGSTNGGAGIQMAYEQALAGAIEGGVNRVILATDGDLNVGITDDDALVRLIQEKADSNVFLTVLGFGEGNLKDGKLEKLADNGNGVYAYIDNLREARKVLVEQIEGSLVTIAKDVKIKVEFNPAEVQAYRLIGYENRLMTAAEFDDDQKDAGEIGAGHSVTALYEIVPAAPTQVATAESLKYQQAVPVVPPEQLTDAAKTGELLTLSLRYKLPESNESTLLQVPLLSSRKRFSEASMDFRFATAVASFGMLLRDSEHRGDTSFAAVEEIASAAMGSDEKGYRTEFLDLVRRAATLK